MMLLTIISAMPIKNKKSDRKKKVRRVILPEKLKYLFRNEAFIINTSLSTSSIYGLHVGYM